MSDHRGVGKRDVRQSGVEKYGFRDIEVYEHISIETQVSNQRGVKSKERKLMTFFYFFACWTKCSKNVPFRTQL